MKRALPILFLVLAMTGCSERQEEGVYVELSLENKENLNSYVLFNPNIKTIEECEATIERAVPSIMANAPKEVPRDSRVTGWKCSLTDPRKDNKELTSS